MSDNVPYKINHAGLFINPLLDTPDFSAHIQTVGTTSLEPYTGADNYATVSVPTEPRALSFIPEGKNYHVYDGKLQHPRGVFMDKDGVQYPQVQVDDVPTPASTHNCNKHNHHKPSSGDKTLMQYYLAGISVVGVLVLARLLR